VLIQDFWERVTEQMVLKRLSVTFHRQSGSVGGSLAVHCSRSSAITNNERSTSMGLQVIVQYLRNQERHGPMAKPPATVISVVGSPGLFPGQFDHSLHSTRRRKLVETPILIWRAALRVVFLP